MKSENNTNNTAGSDCQKRLVSGSFTPGPWKSDGYHVRQSGQRGTRMIADVCYTGPHHTPPNEYPQSCRIVDKANARLIAAAPQMLDALEAADECLALIEDVGHGAMVDNVTVARRVVLAAISSANAESTRAENKS